MVKRVLPSEVLVSPGMADVPVMDLMCSHLVLSLTAKQGSKFNVRRDLGSLFALAGRHLVWPAPVLGRVRAFLARRCVANDFWRGHEVLSDAAFLERHGVWRGPYEEGTLFYHLDEYAKDAPKDLLTLLNTTGQPAEAQLQDRALRERLHKASVARGSRGSQWDHTAIVSQVLKLRAERAQLLGYDTSANFVLADETAANQDNVNAMLRALAPKAVANARREGGELQAMIDAEQKAKGQPSFKLEPWDWAYYSEKVRADKYSFDESQLKPYFEMKSVLENGVFFAATKLYGITFKERTDLPKYHPDTWIYDVFDKDGSHLALFIYDPFEAKRAR